MVSEDLYFDCGNDSTATEGAKVDWQVGVAWRRWKEGDEPIFGRTPPAGIAWVFRDRDFNGGDKMLTGKNVCYTFETSSYGLNEIGPVWNPECQERVCDCDERVQSWLGAESYHVTVETFWYPEWNIKHLEYVCSRMEWSDCFCRASAPIGQPHHTCDADCPEGEQGYEVGHCEEWKWVERDEGWEKYNLLSLGFANPYVAASATNVAGADAEGNMCTSDFTDAWPCYIPVPVIEIQPAGVTD